MAVRLPVSLFRCLIPGIAWFLSHAAAADPQLTISPASYYLLSSQRLDRTHFLYTYDLQITNQGTDGTHISAIVTSQTPTTVIRQGIVAFSDISGGAVGLGRNTFSFVQDRTVAFDPDKLTWTISVLDPLGLSETPTSNQVDERAAALAATLTDTTTSPDVAKSTLRSALRESGFSLRDTNDVLIAPSVFPGEGTAFSVWDVAVTSFNEKHRGLIRISDFTGALMLVFPDADQATLQQAILSDIAAAANSTRPSRRMWARLIIELGKHAPAAYDLLASADPSDATLSTIQMALLAQQLVADLGATASSSPALSASRRSIFKAAESASPGGPIAAGGKSPCTMTEEESLIFDVSQVLANKGFEGVLEYLEHLEQISGKIASRVTAANAVLAYLKFAMTMAAFDSHIEMEGGDQLKRTPTELEGESKTVNVVGTLDIGETPEILNCTRPLLALVGLDFSLFQNGPLKGAHVEWNSSTDYGPGFTEGRLGGADPIAQWGKGTFVPTGDARVSETIADEDGKTHVVVDGAPHRPPVSKNAVQILKKKASLIAFFKIKDSKIIQDLTDALGGGSIIPLGPSWTLPIEMIYRSGIFTKAYLSFTVLDWCDDMKTPFCQWGGITRFLNPEEGGRFFDQTFASYDVDWVLDSERDQKIAHYHPTGNMSFLDSNHTSCSGRQEIKPTDGELVIDYSANPPTWSGSATTSSTTCPGLGGQWFSGAGTVLTSAACQWYITGIASGSNFQNSFEFCGGIKNPDF